MRARISRAALLVKVTARIWCGRGAAARQDMGDARGQDARLAGAGAREHQHRPVQRLDRRALLGVQPVEIGGRARRGAGAGSNAARDGPMAKGRGMLIGQALAFS